MALRLILHAFQTVFGNFSQALKLSFLPFGIVAILIVLTALVGDNALGALLGVLLLVAFIFAIGFIASGWHRYVLLEEEPRLNGPAADRAFPYIFKTILLSLWLMLFLIPVMIIMVPLGMPFLGEDQFIGTGAPDYGVEDMVFELVLGAVVGSIGLLYSLVLPATALEEPMTFRESRLTMSRLGLNVVWLALLLTAVNVAGSVLLVTLLGGSGLLSALISVAVQWLVMMVGISILTTLYGHLVEGRDLPT